jgi:reactive intermediate/imine deaminase
MIGVAVASVAISACASSGSHAPVFVIPNQPSGSFSPVVRVGHLLFLSGQIGIGGDSTSHPGASPIARETATAMDRISAELVTAGSSLDRVAMCTVMLADMNDWKEMNAVYNTYFPKHRPARSSFGASGLAFNARVEIQCIATVD